MIRVLYADEGRRLYHIDGVYEARGLPAIQGRMLVMIEFQHEDDLAGGTRVEASVTGHLRLDTPLMGAVAQLAATLARPTVERAVDRKVRRFFGTVARVSRWAHDQPEEFWAAHLGQRALPPAPGRDPGSRARGDGAGVYIPMKSRAWSMTSSVTVE